MLEKDYLAVLLSHDYSVTGTNVNLTSTRRAIDDFLAERKSGK